MEKRGGKENSFKTNGRGGKKKRKNAHLLHFTETLKKVVEKRNDRLLKLTDAIQKKKEEGKTSDRTVPKGKKTP